MITLSSQPMSSQSTSAQSSESTRECTCLQVQVSTVLNRMIGLFFHPYRETLTSDHYDLSMYSSFSLLEWSRSLQTADTRATLHLPSSVLLEAIKLSPRLEVGPDHRLYRSDERTYACGCRDKTSCSDPSNHCAEYLQLEKIKNLVRFFRFHRPSPFSFSAFIPLHEKEAKKRKKEPPRFLEGVQQKEWIDLKPVFHSNPLITHSYKGAFAIQETFYYWGKNEGDGIKEESFDSPVLKFYITRLGFLVLLKNKQLVEYDDETHEWSLVHPDGLGVIDVVVSVIDEKERVLKGDEHTLILTEHHTVMAKGNNRLGQGGTGSEEDVLTEWTAVLDESGALLFYL